MMLPPEQTKLFIFGRPGDIEALQAEVDADPAHSLLLWPGDSALTVKEYVQTLPQWSAWRCRGLGSGAPPSPSSSSSSPPVLRVVVLDAVYRTARMMFRHLCKMRSDRPPLRHVALHPTTLSVYSRAQNGYAAASAKSVEQSGDPAALRICTVEAVALLLGELGEPPRHTRPLIDAVVANNEALGTPTGGGGGGGSRQDDGGPAGDLVLPKG